MKRKSIFDGDPEYQKLLSDIKMMIHKSELYKGKTMEKSRWSNEAMAEAIVKKVKGRRVLIQGDTFLWLISDMWTRDILLTNPVFNDDKKKNLRLVSNKELRAINSKIKDLKRRS